MTEADKAFRQLVEDVHMAILPIIKGRPNVQVLCALVELVVLVSNNGQRGKSRADALNMLQIVIAQALKTA